MNLFAPKPIGPAPVYAATLSDNEERIVLRGRMSPVVKEWIPCLPGARWVGAKLCWTLDATPACAWRLLGHAPFRVEPDVAVLALSARFLPAPGALPASQPPLRLADLWKHQIEPYHFADAREGSLLSMWMGTGKSAVAVDLLVNRACKRVLVVCPVSVLGVWRREIAKWAALPFEVLVLDKPSWGVRKKTEAAAKFLRANGGLRGRPCAVVVNYETCWRMPFGEWSLAQQWDAIVGDEIHRAKGHGTAQGKHMGALSKVGGLRLGLSGTPMDHSPLDLFGVARFVDRGIFGTSFHAFRNRYAEMDDFVPGKVAKWQNLDELRERLSLFAVHVGEDVLDLPPVQHIERTLALGAKTMQAYLELEGEMIAQVEAGVVTPANAMVRLLRLQQLTSGFVGGVEDPDGNHVLAVLGEEKRELLGDILLDLPEREPVVVFCRFTQDLLAVRGLAETLGRRYGELSGNQHDLTPTAEMPEGIDVYGVQIKSGGVGVDLTRACYCVYYSVGFSLGDFLQSLARLQRPGQRRSVRAYHLMADGTVDHAVYGALRARHDLIAAVLSVLKKGRV